MDSERMMLNTFKDMKTLIEILMVRTIINPECYQVAMTYLESLISKWQETWQLVKTWLLETDLDSHSIEKLISDLLERVPCSETVKSGILLSINVYTDFWQEVLVNLKLIKQSL
jgi:hypothetical protein